MADTPYADELFPEKKPYADELFPDSMERDRARRALGTSPVQDFMFSRDGILARTVGSFADGFGEMTVAKEAADYMRTSGWFGDYNDGQASISKAMNEALVRPAVWALVGGPEAVFRSLSGAFHVAQEAIAGAGEAVGQPRLGRELAAIPEAFPHPRPIVGMFGLPEGAGAVGTAALIDRARAAKVIGAGEQGWRGTAQPEPTAKPVKETPAMPSVAQESVLPVEGQSAIEKTFATAPESPAAPAQADVHSAARGIAPDLFYRYDDLQAKRDTYSAQLSELNDMRARDAAQAAEIADLRGKLAEKLSETETQAREMAPAVKEAYAEAQKVTTPEPDVTTPVADLEKSSEIPAENVTTPVRDVTTPARSVDEQRATIAKDIEDKLVAAGRPESEAKAAAAIDAAYWVTRAERFKGAKGTAEEMYRREAPEILGPGMKSDYATPRAKPRQERVSLGQFISHIGIKDNDPLIGDVKSITGGRKYIRKDGMSLDAAREAAVEQGYLPEKSTVRDLLDGLRSEDKGTKVFKAGEEAPTGFDRDSHINAIEQALDDGLREVGIDPKDVSAEVRTRTVEIMDKEHITDPVAAYEKAEAEAGMFQRDMFDTQTDMFDAPNKAKPVEAAAAPELPNEKPVTEKPASNLIEQKGIEDFGEKIEGARKDTFAGFRDSLHEDLNVLAEPLSKSFPQPNYEKLAASGVSKRALAYIAIMRDMIPNRPRKAWKAKEWGKQVETLRGFARMLLDGDVDTAALDSKMKDNYALKTLPLTAEAIENVAPADLPRAAQYRINSGSYSMLNGQRYSPSKSFWFIESPEGRSSFRNPLSNDPANPYTYRETPAEVVNLAKQIIPLELEKKAAAPEQERSKYTDVNLYRDRASGGVFIGFKVRSTVIRLKAGFEDVKAAREYLQENRDGLQSTIDTLREGPNERGTENRPRTGESLRAGDVSPQSFDETFGFRGVQFGNYVEDVRRQSDLNRAFDALMDLADVLGVPPKALSLDGQLGLAFGARGTGGKRAAAAHYEPTQIVINLTKGAGPGSLAHEWLHAVDNYFARKDVGKDRSTLYMSANHRDAGLVRDEVYQAWKNVENTLQSGSFAERSAKFDEARSKPYFNTTIEKAARSFEKYVVDRLAEKGAVNDYLANIDTAGGAYPTNAEMQSLGIRAAYDRLFDTIETRETDRGVEMYQATGVKRGRIRLREDGRNTITLLKDANASTFIHEKGHDYLARLIRDAKDEAAPIDLKTDAEAVFKWLGVKDGDGIKTSHHEKFARGFENYVMEGRAPSHALARVFEQFRQWLVKIYTEASRLKAPINDDIRAVFDRMLSVEPEKTVIAPDRTPAITADRAEASAAGALPAQADAAASTVKAESATVEAKLPEAQRARLAEIAAGLEDRPSATAGTDDHGNAPGTATAGNGSGERVGTDQARGNQASPEGNSAPAKPAGPSVKTEAPGNPHEPFNLTGDIADKAGNIRLDLLNAPDDVKNIISQVADENGQFQKVRGPVTDIQVAELADAMGMDAAYLSTRKLGEAWTAPQIVALRNLLIQSATEVRDLMRKAAQGNEADLLAYAEAKQRHLMIQERVSSVTAEAGRALRAFQGKFTGMGDAKALGDFLKKETGQTLFQLEREVQLGMSLETPSQVSKFIHDSRKATTAEMVQEAWINALLSGPITHVKNIIGNTAVAVLNVGETAATAAVGKVREILGNDAERVRMGEAQANLFGLIKGAQDGLVAAKYAFLHEEQYQRAQTLEQGKFQAIPSKRIVLKTYDKGSPEYNARIDAFANARARAERLTGEKLAARVEELKSNPTPDMVADAAENAVEIGGKQVRLPGRMLTAEDELFKTIAYRQKLNELAYRQAHKEGLSGDAFNARMAHLTMNPTEEMMTTANKAADYQTFTNTLGQFGQSLQRMSNAHFLAKMVVPFIRTPLNLLKYANERTPLGVFSREVRANLSGVNGKIAQDTQIARMAIGTSLAATTMYLADQGFITGGGPSDKNEKAMLMLSGWRPYSIKIGDTYYSYGWLDPFSTIMGISADISDAIKNGADVDESEMAKVATGLFASISKNILSKASLRGASDILNALTDPDRYGPKYLQNLAGTVIPSGVAQQAKARDEYQREVRTILDSWKSRLHGLRQDLMPKRDIWGEPMAAGENLGPDSLSPVGMSKLTNDRATQALIDAELFPAKLTRKIRGVDLTDQQYDDFARIAGRMAKMRVNAIVSNPGFDQAPVEIRKNLLKGVIDASRDAARSMILVQNPSIIKQALDEKLASVGR